MAKIDLKPLSLKDLHGLRARVDKAIERFENKKRNAALAALKAEAKKLGFSLDDLTGGTPVKTRKAKKKPGPKKPSVVAYRDTEDKNNTWAGRGPRPKWLKDALGKGKKLEDFKV